MRKRNVQAFRLLILVSAVAWAACGEGTQPTGIDGPPGTANLRVYAEPMSPAASVLVVEVTAVDIATPIAKNFDVVGGVASGIITLPAG